MLDASWVREGVHSGPNSVKGIDPWKTARRASTNWNKMIHCSQRSLFLPWVLRSVVFRTVRKSVGISIDNLEQHNHPYLRKSTPTNLCRAKFPISSCTAQWGAGRLKTSCQKLVIRVATAPRNILTNMVHCWLTSLLLGIVPCCLSICQDLGREVVNDLLKSWIVCLQYAFPCFPQVPRIMQR